jgi:S1-C subfamily serine protease
MVNISFNPLSNSNLSVENDFVSAAEKTIHSVVHVKNTSISGGNSSLWDYFNNSGGKTRVGMGSGVIISEDGYIITNNHVIENASTIEITTNNNKTYNAELLGSDEVSDIAVLKIVGDESFPYIRFADLEFSPNPVTPSNPFCTFPNSIISSKIFLATLLGTANE